MSDALQALQRWYLTQCNGDWEHSNGIKIDTLDNPGWSLCVDLSGTTLSGRPFQPVSRLDHPSEWLDCKRTETQFQGFGGPLMLPELIHVFLPWAEQLPYDRNA
jgi:hypothetical protein